MLKKLGIKGNKNSKKIDRSVRMYNAKREMNKLEIERINMLNTLIY